MLNNIDATKEKTVIGELKLYKVVIVDEMDPSVLKDPHIKGEKFSIGEQVFRPVEIITDGFDAFVYKGILGFDKLEAAWDCINLLSKHYPSMDGVFTVAEITIPDSATYYSGYELRDGKQIKVYAVDSFKVEGIVEPVIS